MPLTRLIQLMGVYPNPMSENAKIYFMLRNPAEVTTTIYSISGEMIFKQSLELAAGSNVQVWNGGNNAGMRCASGIYLVKILAKMATGELDEFWSTLAIAR